MAEREKLPITEAPGFLHTDLFKADCRRLRFTIEDLAALERVIALDRTAGAVMAGTGGIRKLRFAPPSWRRGKSGAVRVCFAVMPRPDKIMFVVAFAKNERENLSKAEKAALKQQVQFIARTWGSSD
jgi:hypothetical protein